MPRLINNNIISPADAFASRRELDNNKTMKREFVFPLVVGLILGGLLMIFWQFNARLNNAANAMAQIETAVSQNTKTVADIVAFINNPNGQAQKTTPEATPVK